MNIQEIVFKKLDEMNLKYEVIKHDPVYTIQEVEDLNVDFKGANVVKNLFLKDNNGKKHYLIVMGKDKQANLKDLRGKLASSALSFASEQRLDKYLKLKKGAVSPLGVINDLDNHVEVVIDKDLERNSLIGVHPNENTATVLMSLSDLVSLIETVGNTIRYIEI